MYCKYIDLNDRWQCEYCKTTVPKLSEKSPISYCLSSIKDFNAKQNQRLSTMTKKYVGQYKSELSYGPGTELKKLLSLIGINSSPNCSCNQKAKMMNEWGPEVCEKQIDLIVSWLKDEAQTRRLPFVESLAKLLVKRAIKNARKNISSSSRP